MKKDSITKNFSFQMLYQVLILVFPLIISPHLSRTLGSTALGDYTFINGIAYYCVVFSMLGIMRHGQRVISKVSDDPIELRKQFWSLLYVHLFFSIIITAVYFLVIRFVNLDNKILYLIEGIYIASAIFDLTWFFYGIEKFKVVAIINFIVKLTECTLILILVKTSNDVWIYALVLSLGFLITNLTMWPFVIFKIKPIKCEWKDISIHIKPMWFLFASIAATLFYTTFNRTMIGLLSTMENVAFYDYSNRIVEIPKAVIAVIATITFPRACIYVKEHNKEEQVKLYRNSMIAVGLLAIPSIFGLLSVANTFAVLYYGGEFAICGNYIMVLTPLIIIVGLGEIIRVQLMISNNMDKLYVLSTFINLGVYLVIAFSTIPFIGVYGAAIATISAELCGLIFQCIVTRKKMNHLIILKELWPFLIFGLVMYLGLLLFNFISNPILALVFKVVTGFVFYMSVSMAYLLIFKKDFFKSLFSKKDKQVIE